jgi:hypothetical protein
MVLVFSQLLKLIHYLKINYIHPVCSTLYSFFLIYLFKVKSELSTTFFRWYRGEFLILKYPATIMIAYDCLDLIIKMNSSISFRNFFLI